GVALVCGRSWVSGGMVRTVYWCPVGVATVNSSGVPLYRQPRFSLRWLHRRHNPVALSQLVVPPLAQGVRGSASSTGLLQNGEAQVSSRSLSSLARHVRKGRRLDSMAANWRSEGRVDILRINDVSEW